MTKEYEILTLSDLQECAVEIATALPKGVVLFRGEMGAGKTTTIAQLCKAWGVEDRVQSPTFSLVNEYHTLEGEVIYHFDFYRLENEEEALDMGYEDYLWSGARCLIEWPEKIPTLLPAICTEIRIRNVNGCRIVEVTIPDTTT